MDRWIGRVALVTGASSGIGREISKALITAGINVVGLARREERLQSLEVELEGKPGKFYWRKCDLKNETEILEAFDWINSNLGGVDILIANAGIYKQDLRLIDGKTSDFKDTLDTNVLHVCICCREAIKSMKSRNFDGHIIIMNSLAGHYTPIFENISMNIYSPSKFALTAYCDVLRQELFKEKLKIKLSSLSPGYTQTEIENVFNSPAMTVEDCANAVLYILSTPPHLQVTELTIRPILDGF